MAAARALDTEDVPIEFFDDMQGNPGVMAGEITDQAKVDKLAASIAEDGITEPLILEFHPGTGLVWLGEGNHRLAAARQLGLDSVPVRGMRYEPTPSEVRLSGDGKRLSPYTLEHLDNDDWFGEAWVNESGERLEATFTPSQVGVPTAGVARETGEAAGKMTNAEIQEVFDMAAEAGNANPYVTVTEAGHKVPLKDELGAARYEAYELYLDNVRDSPGVYSSWTADRIIEAAESRASEVVKIDGRIVLGG